MPPLTQNLRILYLMDIMLQRTDDHHMLNAVQLCEILEQEYSLPTDRRTIYSDLEILEKYGLDVQQKRGKKPGYYIGARDFELPELKLLVDAVQSSKFITENKSRELIRKLEKLCCRTDADILAKQVFVVNRPKTENETIYYNVDKLHTAIFENREIAFQYAEWTMQKKIRLKKDGAMYVVSPWALTWDDENYYLVAYDAVAGIIKHYRVDKMLKMAVLETERKGKEAFEDFDLADFAKKTFGMYGGADAEVSLICEQHLAGVILDRFGHDVWMRPVDSEHFHVKVLVAVSSQFFGWVTGIGKGLEIEGPENIREQYKEYLQELLTKY
ncbi:helix-turn-helix transcriptional regulator [Blautia sp. MSJ-19]|uniref:helix-turn-helix transcriptional regulator n=1 Tax=Blautia sp. MSJ-19 TaxID=2841517 RepID=UPI001C0EB69F|nr:WYL domain-containing protein [Blautia sp. MSJ-19]MBU5480273.1 WYL domain-containing protein [Blautia sp. MSJ-19]